MGTERFVLMKQFTQSLWKAWPSLCMCGLVALIALAMISCAEKEAPKEQFTITLATLDWPALEEAFPALTKEYADAHPDLSIQVKIPFTTVDQFLADPGSAMADTDVLLFPSTALKALEAQAHSFYPITDIGFTPSPSFASLFTSSTGYWAVPLILDPLVCLVKAEAMQSLGESTIPADWSSVRLASNALLDSGSTLPHIYFYPQTDQSLADSIAALQFAFGYRKTTLQGMPELNFIDQELFEKGLARSNSALKSYMTQDAELTALPLVQSVSEFIASPSGLMTFARLSTYLELSAEDQAKLLAGAVPTAEQTVLPSYALAAGIPLESKNPSLAEAFIHFLIVKTQTIAKNTGTLATPNPLDNTPVSFPDSTLFLLRTNPNYIDTPKALNLLNDKTPVMEANQAWEAGYFIPSATP